jgi:Tfp pilus assembly protein PilF
MFEWPRRISILGSVFALALPSLFMNPKGACAQTPSGSVLASGCLEAVTLRGEMGGGALDLKSYSTLFEKLMSDLQALDALKHGAGLTSQDMSCLNEKTKLLDELLKKEQPEFRQSADYLTLLGDYYMLKDNTEQARSSYMAALDRDTLHIRANMSLARIARSEGDQKLEDLYLKRAIGDTPKTDGDRKAQSQAFARLVELSPNDEAYELIKAWEKISPNDSSLSERLNEVALKSQNAEKLESALPQLKEPLRSYFAGELAALKKNFTQVVSYMTQYLKNSHEQDRERSLAARFRLASAYLELNEAHKARVVIEGALKKDPGSQKFLALYEQALDRGGLDSKKLKEDLQRALSFYPTSTQIRLRLVEALADSPSGDPLELRQAEALVDRMLASDPVQIDALYFKVLLLQKRKAFTVAEKFVSLMLQELRKAQAPKARTPEANLWIAASQNFNARGLFGEAKSLLQEGLNRVEAREDKDKLRQALKSART